MMTKSWNYKPQEKVIVRCYASLNQDNIYVELKCNGKVIGKSKRSEEDGSFTFSVNFEAGTLSALMYSEDGEVLAQSALVTTDNPERLNVRLYQEKDVLTGKSWEEISKEIGYIYQLEVELQDKNDQLVVWEDKEISVQVQGAGELIGIDNGDLADITPFSANWRKTFQGKLIVYVRRIEKGDIEILLKNKAGGNSIIQIKE